MPPPRLSRLRGRAPRARPAQREFSGAAGQATVELVALLPILAVLGMGVWQVAIAGHTVWAAGAAARAAARAEAVGGRTEAAARRLLPERVRSTAKVDAFEDGEVRVVVPVPAIAGGGTLFTTTARARFEPQR